MKRPILWLPLSLFVVLMGMVALALYSPTDHTIESKLIGQPVPAFALPPAVPGKPALDSKALASGQPRLLNFFASWCGPCAVEAPQLMALARRGVPIDAIAVKDKPADVADFLARSGDPFQRIGSDVHSSVQIALGSSGVPETFIIDGKGIIRHQHIGDIRPEDVPKLLAAWQAAR